MTKITLANFAWPNDYALQEIDGILNKTMPFPAHDVCSILLYGPPGVGKSKMAEILFEEFRMRYAAENNIVYRPDRPPVKKINCKEFRTVEDVRSWRKTAYYTPLNGDPVHYFFLDEVDRLSRDAADELSSVMDLRNGIFVMTTNFINNVHDSVKGRCIVIDFTASIPAYRQFVRKSLANLGVENADGLPNHLIDGFIDRYGTNVRQIAFRLPLLKAEIADQRRKGFIR